MKILIKNTQIISDNKKYSTSKFDILIKNNIISKIADSITENADEVLEGKNLVTSVGWFDTQVNFFDPGFEHKEDINSGAKAALAGGFSEVAVMPNTLPVVDSKSGIEYITNKSKFSPIKIHPIGALSEKLEGKNIAELYDMKTAGAIAFSDNKKSIASPELLKRALLYTKPFDGLIINFPNEQHLSGEAQINESITNTKLGLKGSPNLAEEIMVQRDIFLAEYCDAKIHFSTISTAGSVNLIRAAKQKGLKISCSVALHNLIFDDSEIEKFDSNYKVFPPLRTQIDIEALIAGINDGTIDCITTDHTPQDVECKKLEFEHAEYGISGLETAFSAYNTHLSNKINLETYIRKISSEPRAIFGIEQPTIGENQEANLTIIDTEENTTYTETAFQSKGKNNPFLGTTLKGKVVKVIC